MVTLQRQEVLVLLIENANLYPLVSAYGDMLAVIVNPTVLHRPRLLAAREVVMPSANQR